MLRIFSALILSIILVSGAFAQETAPAPDRSGTGGAQTLEDIMARQQGLKVDNGFRSGVTGNPAGGADISALLGTRGGASDADLWRGLRFDSVSITTQARGPAASVLIQDGGMRWLTFRQGPLLDYGMKFLGATLALLVLFFLIRGRIRIDGEKTGETIVRFKAFERFSHCLLYTSDAADE